MPNHPVSGVTPRKTMGSAAVPMAWMLPLPWMAGGSVSGIEGSRPKW